MYKLLRPILFNLSKDPETVHNIALFSLRFAGLSPFRQILSAVTKVQDPALCQKVFGLEFKNPVGLAAGFDKDGKIVAGLEALGFGFVEVGTVTKLSQPGNARQRLFRLSEDEALINRMGFNNRGADSLRDRLSLLYPSIAPLGVNLGKSKLTDLSEATQDYLYSFSKLYDFGDYFVINISSPNTPGLRQLQDKSAFTDLISAVVDFRQKQTVRKPILVKVVVDFTLEAVDEILEVCGQKKIDGIICSNTSVSRAGLKTHTDEIGGLSGRPIRQKSTEYIRHIRRQSPNLPVIGVGGIFSAEDAYEKIKAGASLVQVYTGFIYEGPFIAKRINRGLLKLLERDGFKNISEAMGIEAK